MSKSSKDSRVSNLIKVKSTKRNSWGSQVDSFKDKIDLNNEFSVSSISMLLLLELLNSMFCNDCSIIGHIMMNPVLLEMISI